MFLVFCGFLAKSSAKDIAAALGYSDPKGAINQHCKYLKSLRGVKSAPQEIQPQTLIIPEKDIYRLIMRSNLPAAEKFHDWVMDEVLPSIRKHGFYGTDDFVEMAIADPGCPASKSLGSQWLIGTLHPFLYSAEYLPISCLNISCQLLCPVRVNYLGRFFPYW